MKLLVGNSIGNLHTDLYQNILKLRNILNMIVVSCFILDSLRAEMEKGMYLTLSIKGCDDVNIC